MKAACFSLICLALTLFIVGCEEDTERQNPLDVQNEATAGVPPGLTARAGDSEVVLSWPNLGIEGVREYRIYRAHLTPAPGQFQYIASIEAKPRSEASEYIYTDTGLQNDGDNVYFYRLTYVDENGGETPDPSNPQNLSSDWYLVDLIPSVAPPAPTVQVIEDTDLQVRLVWEGYSDIAPDDLVGFRIYCALKSEAGQEQENLACVAEIYDPELEFYIDGNDYTTGIVNFREDNVTKLYKVVAFDKYGVESDSPILEGTSPNLPPGQPRDINIEYESALELGWDWIQVTVTWEPCTEPDVAGYVLYEVMSDGQWEFKKMVKGRDETELVVTDRLDDLFFGPFGYQLVAFDNTPQEDGNRDESMEKPLPSIPGGGFLNIGDEAPDFTLPTLDGGTVRLHDLKGKVVLMDFFATWCGPCIMAVPHIQDLHEKYKDQGLVVLGIDLAETEMEVRPFRDMYGLTYDILMDLSGFVGTLYGIEFIPTVWLIDRDGFIAWQSIGYMPGSETEMEQQIQSLL